LTVVLADDGRANPSVMLGRGGSGPILQRLDVVAADFVHNHGVDLIKTDTEGYDFAVLRSAETILRQHRPAVYFEWYPELLLKVGEDPTSVFSFLGELGYRYWVLFTNCGEIHCQLSRPEINSFDLLSKVALCGRLLPYFDVFASTDEEDCRLVAESYFRSCTPEPHVLREKSYDAVHP
jgi:hypothetical protein